jgi:hypothetical protein
MLKLLNEGNWKPLIWTYYYQNSTMRKLYEF